MITGRLAGLAGLILALSACGSAAPATSPAGSTSTAATGSAAAGASAAKPAGNSPLSSGASGSSTTEPKPEKAHLEVGIASPAGTAYLVQRVAVDGGYYGKHGLDVAISVLSSAPATQALVSGKADIYQGGATAIGARLQAADVIYVGAASDKNTQLLVGQKNITTVEQLKGKSVATTAPGAFGEIAMRKTAKEHNMEVGKDIKLLFHPSSAAAYATFINGGADAFILTPPFSIEGQSKGYPVIVDYLKDGLKIIGPGFVVNTSFYKQNPKTVRAYLEGYLDGLKRTLDDPAYAKQLDIKYNQLSDPKVADADYDEGLEVWNKDMRVDPSSIQVVLDATDDPKAKSANPKDFYDNTIVEQVNQEYASKLFPGDVK